MPIEDFIILTAVQCSQVWAPRNGLKDGVVFLYLSDVKFFCFPGYQMDGLNKTVCQADGQWSSPVPTCTGE